MLLHCVQQCRVSTEVEIEPAAHEQCPEVYWPLISNARTGEKAKEISKSQIPIFPNFLGLVLGGGGGRPDYLQKLKVPEGYEKMIDYSNI